MKPHQDELELIRQLTSDPLIVGECPECGSSFPMKRWNLFYGDSFPDIARPFIEVYMSQAQTAKAEYGKAKLAATKGASKKSVEVNVGKVVEKMAPVLDGFPFHPNDCRGLFEPIDYVVFKGLYESGRVKEIKFLDIKTGGAKLNNHQKWIKDAVEGGRVKFAQY